MPGPTARDALMLTVRKIETVSGDFYTEEGEPFWRIEVDGYCADFDHEAAAQNFADAVNRCLTPTSTSDHMQQPASGEVAEMVPDMPCRLSEEDAFRELKLLYNYRDDDSRQFTRWNMICAIRHGHMLERLAAPTPIRDEDVERRILNAIPEVHILISDGHYKLAAEKLARAALSAMPQHPQVDAEPVASLFTPERIEAANAETERLQRELDITNADHIALWLEANKDDSTLGWLACRIIEAHEQEMRLAELRAPPSDSDLREALNDGVATLAAVRATATTDEWSDSADHFAELCRETIGRMNSTLSTPAPPQEGYDLTAVYLAGVERGKDIERERIVVFANQQADLATDKAMSAQIGSPQERNFVAAAVTLNVLATAINRGDHNKGEGDE